MDTLFAIIFILILGYALYSVIMAFIKKSKYKTWQNSINATGKVIKTEILDKKSAKVYLEVHYNGSDFPLELIMPKKQTFNLNIEIGSYLPIIYDKINNEAKNEEFYREDYKKCFLHSWVSVLVFCALFIIFIEFIGGGLSSHEFSQFSRFYQKNRP